MTSLRKNLFRLFNGHRKSQALILLYHRVGNLPKDVYQLTVSTEHFAEQLDYLKQHSTLVHLHELVQASRDGSLPDRAVAITFDDGYVNNYTHAFPLLREAEAPATIFITTGNIDSPTEFWWDRLERVILRSTDLPDRLRIQRDGVLHEWQISGEDEVRQTSYRQLLRFLRDMSPTDRATYLDEIEQWAGEKPAQPSHRVEYRTMKTGEICELADSPYIELGAHTITHPLLSRLPSEEQSREIMGSKDQLAKLISRPVRYFSYPFGDYNDASVKIVSEMGFMGAVTTQTGTVHNGSDQFRLNRCAVRDWNYQEFGNQLERYFNDQPG